ncbi:DUF2157 domain-containing protein [Novosphingobium sp. RD2P27]|uniref:DUF2157 domain-containing protein n=1 Tax=Novosphingobium kalidii TaxID=3230299 RepID=A0ABV2CX33_9SPHN
MSRRVMPGRELAVLRAAGIIPKPAQWRKFLEQIALWLGTLALAAAVIFFFAFNWDDLGRLVKIGLAEAAILVALLACWQLDLDGGAGKAALTLGSLLVGALLALTGQIYQTGADTFELFAYWAALILPWVLIGRFAALWLVWLGLINTAVFLYFVLGRDEEPLLWALFVLNGLALVGWEIAHRAGLAWLRERWPARLIAMASAGSATVLILWAIVERSGGSAVLTTFAYLGWLTAIYAWYRGVRADLFMLAIGVLSLIVAVAAFLLLHLPNSGGVAFLFIGLIVIGLSAAGALWLKSVARE